MQSPLTKENDMIEDLTEVSGERQPGTGHQGQNYATHFISQLSHIEGILDPKRFCD